MEYPDSRMSPEIVKKAEKVRNDYDNLTKDLKKHVPKSVWSQVMGNIGKAQMASSEVITEDGLEEMGKQIKDLKSNFWSYADRASVKYAGADAGGVEIETKKTEKVKEVRPTPETFFEQIKVVEDPKNYEVKDAKIISYRSQWDNNTGQTFYNTPAKSSKRDLKKEYDNVTGVGHFLLDASALNGSTYMHGNNFSYIKKSIDNDEYIPVFSNQIMSPGEVNMTYKKPSEMNEEELKAVKIFQEYNDKAQKLTNSGPAKALKSANFNILYSISAEYAKAIDNNEIKIVSPLRQFTYDDIDFDSSKRAKGFISAKYLMSRDGAETNLLFTNDSKNVYGRYDGATVSFIFKDEYGNSITRDFSGTINGIREEGKSIKDKYKLKENDLVVGYHDVGSFSAKPAARNGKLSANDFDGYNTSDGTGSALIMKGPKDNTSPLLSGMEETISNAKKSIK